ncbi:MAG: 4Fe-4S binding protein [Prevotellaceae bacterium]|nr:4Fe-4S binding protein [Candidatus Minthosoma caballi]
MSSLEAFCVARFPKPDFDSGYQYPDIEHPVPWENFWNILDIVLLTVMMGIVAWAIHKKESRKAIFCVSIISVLYFGFFRNGCVCSVGSLQNVVLAFTDPTYNLPWFVLLLFILPIVFTLIFGRVFCAGVCPLGALQEIVNIKNFRISRAVSQALSVIPWIYLGFAILYAATRSQFIICRFDPFIGIFRFGGDIGMIVFGITLLLLSMVVARPFCQFLCPYGALLSIFGKFAIKKMEVTRKGCINCTLCHNSCPVDALRPPYANKQKEERSAGVKRLIMYFLILPIITAACSFLVGLNSENLSRANKDVHLYDMIQAQEENPDMEMPMEVVAFHELGNSVDELAAKVDDIQKQFSIYSYIVGALIGFVIGIKLINLSVKRTRKTYEIDYSACVACGKCFDYCPQNMSPLTHSSRSAFFLRKASKDDKLAKNGGIHTEKTEKRAPYPPKEELIE